MKYARELRTAVTAVVVLTVLLGVIYPLVVTAIAQVAMPGNADGSKVKGGSSLIAQPWVIDTGKRDSDGNAVTRPNPKYFQPRPSATGYSATATYFANRGPNSAAARYFYRDNLAAYIALEGPYNQGLKNADVPVDAVTASASGVDPHITVANARIQAKRVAARRGLSSSTVDKLVDKYTDGRFIGLFGERGVNTTKLNLALDKEVSR
jgi:K+-transporting ATPase ATPase C chain